MRGDVVRTTDPYTGETSDQPVIATITGTGTKHLVDVVTDAGTWTATANHPIWIDGKGWTPAGELTAGDRLVGSTGGILVVKEMHDRGWLSGQTVYNLSVSTTHTYYITSGDGNVDALVHNCGVNRAVYVFTGTTGRKYVGISSNIDRRLAQHVRAGSVTPANALAAQRFEVSGSRLSMRIAEQRRINGFGGVGVLQNRINSIAPRHWSRHGIV